jgi:simple sugar transport system permease protein
MFVGGVGAGALWGGIAGWLRVKRNVQEVISTIMLNYIALYMLQWVVVGPLQDRAHKIPQSDPIPDAALLPRLLPSSLSDGIQTRLHSGFFLALLAALAVYLFLFLTPQGFALRLLGQNPDAAKTARVPVDKLRIRAMLLSGGLCGLAGVVELLGITGRLYPNFSPGWGYTAIPVALLGGLHPIGTFFSALFFGALNAGTGNLSRYWGVSSALIYVIQGVAVLAIVGGRAWKNRQIGSETD